MTASVGVDYIYPSGVIAGQDATEVFYGLHRHEVLEKPQYQRLQIGVIADEKSVIHGRIVGELSKVPYAEPTWLSTGYHSPFYTDVHEAVDSLPFLALTLCLRITGPSRRPFANSLMRLLHLMQGYVMVCLSLTSCSLHPAFRQEKRMASPQVRV